MTFHELATSPVLILSLGVGWSYLGYGPLSRRKNPKASVALAGIGLLCRLAGPLLLLWAGCILLFIISMTWMGR